MKKFLSFILIAFLLSACSTKFRISYFPVFNTKANYDFTNAKATPITKDVRVALVLGGGGARAIAHLGILEVLEENNIPIDLIVGTSGGSIIGALYADKPDAKALKEVTKRLNKEDFVDFSLLSAIHSVHSLTNSFANGKNGEKFLLNNMTARNFEDLKIPFIAVATDMISGKTVPLNKGPIAPAVRASYSIPGLFAPVEMYGMTLVDGGVTAPLAIDVAKQYHPNVIIAVDLSLGIDKSNVSNLVDLVFKSLSINYKTLNDLMGKEADVLIKPKIEKIGIFDAHRREELYIAGRKAALAKLPEIKKQLSKKTNKTNNWFWQKNHGS